MAETDAALLRDRLERISHALRRAEERAGRSPGTVKLVAVTKTVPAERIREAWDLGVRTFGENYVQEAVAKMDALPSGIDWHFIGRLQTNKARQALEAFSVVESVDRPSLAEALEKAARARGVRFEVLVQVNLGGEETKAGAPPEGAVELLRRAPEWPHLKISGLMAIPPYSPDPEETRPYFRALRELRERIWSERLPGVDLPHLSMGMSGDYEVAVEEGATIVRIGTALFGPRTATD